jgi:transcriptional regulator with XRE-family HTH domain
MQGANRMAEHPGQRIRELRERRGFTLDDLVASSGVSKGFLSEVENGKRGLSAENVLKIATALGASLDYLLRGEMQLNVRQEAVTIPPELASFAAELNLSYRETVQLLNAHNSVVARRSDVKQTLSIDDWRQLHETLKKVYE